jgi:RNA polymerase sigma-70 factor, ECF subfamily
MKSAKPLILLDIAAFGFFLEFVRRKFKTSCPAVDYRALAARDSGSSRNGLVIFLTHEISWDVVVRAVGPVLPIFEESRMEANQDNMIQLKEFEAAAMPYRNELVRAAASMLGNRTEAEDIVQTLYLQAWQSFHRFTLGTNCRAWLYQILFHIVSHHRRKWINKGQLREDLETVEMSRAWEAPVPEELRDEDMLAAFQKLPRHYAEVVMLADVHEFSYKEIRDRLGIPIGTVMSRLNRGRRILRQHLVGLADLARFASSRQATA